jgi:saccharopine dehydrogenase-like NADP-dependent oxidoreductase
MMKIAVLGAGKVGTTIAIMLQSCDFCTEILLSDVVQMPTMNRTDKLDFRSVDFNNKDEVTRLIDDKDAVVSAAPFYLNRLIAECCADAGVAYFDLTEDISTTDHIRKLAQHSPVVFMSQCGLAPGAINIIAGSYARLFSDVRSLELRVGALPLEGVERLTIDGTEYEAFNTSGGVATMCETFEGEIDDLNYKTIRYPCHRDLMVFLLQDLNLCRNRAVLTQILDQQVPLTGQDVVILYVNVVGSEQNQIMQRSFVKKIYGQVIDGTQVSAIQLSTAAGLVAILEIFADGGLQPGLVKQEDIPLKAFFATR